MRSVIRYTYVAEENIVHVYPGASLTFEAMRAYVDAILADERIADGFIELVHFDIVDEFSWKYAQTEKILNLFKRLHTKKRQMGTIFLVDTSLQLGMARMIQAIFEEHIQSQIAHSVKEVSVLIQAMRANDQLES